MMLFYEGTSYIIYLSFTQFLYTKIAEMHEVEKQRE